MVGGGASAALHLDEILAWPGEVMAINGAFDWLRSGRVPDWHLILDPQPLCAGFVRHPSRLAHYLVADCVDPSVLDALDGQRVTLWQPQAGAAEGPDGVPGGPSAMTRAPVLAALLGYRRIDLFGADCCYPVDSAAPAHVWDRDPAGWWCLVGCDGMLWRSQPQLLRQAVFLAEALPAMRRAGLDIRLRGQGHLAAAMLRTGGRWFDALAATDMLETGELLEPAER